MYRTQKLALKVDNIVLPPICIPSYSRPEARLLQLLRNKGLDVILFIRKNEYALYEQYANIFKIVLLKRVTNIGNTRKAIIEYALCKGINELFMWDDDINELDYTYPGITRGGKAAMRAHHIELGQKPDISITALKMWYCLVHKCKYEIALSAPLYRPYSWNPSYANLPLKYNSRDCIQCVYINTRLFKQHDINYMDTNDIGAEDLALQFDIMKKGLYTIAFTDLEYNCPAMGSGVGGCNATEYEVLMEEKSAVMDDRLRRFMQYTGNHPGVREKKMSNGWKSPAFNWKYWRN